jgi:hypothetical protein
MPEKTSSSRVIATGLTMPSTAYPAEKPIRKTPHHRVVPPSPVLGR